ncbi:hypothetical protein TNCV_3969201 [Trichonephila clavipes]|nr:hypothetical protein TNCV_3969201 [Trichonephila clavipes]
MKRPNFSSDSDRIAPREFVCVLELPPLAATWPPCSFLFCKVSFRMINSSNERLFSRQLPLHFLISLSWGLLSLVNTGVTTPGCPSDPSLFSTLFLLIKFPVQTTVSAVPGFCQMTGTVSPLLDSVVGGGTPGRSSVHAFRSNAAVPV